MGNSLTKSFKAHLSDKTSFSNQVPFLLGVSGGIDSMVLLHLTHRVRDSIKGEPLVVHYNYCYHHRSDEAQALVQDAAESMNMSFIATNLVESTVLEESSEGLESKARKLRYNFFGNVAKICNAKFLLLAQHRLDQIETILLNIGRGTGVGGLSGMQFRTKKSGLEILRPLISCRSKTINDYATDNEIPYVDDPTNERLDYARNRIRREILPAWRDVQPDPDTAIYNLGRRVSRENDFWQEYIDENFVSWDWPTEIQLKRSVFRRDHPAAQLRFLVHSLTQLKGDTKGWSEQNFKDIRNLFDQKRSGAAIDLPGNFRARNEYNRGCFYKTKESGLGFEEFSLELVSDGRKKKLDNIGIISLQKSDEREFANGNSMLYTKIQVDASTSLRVRSWEQGDCYKNENGQRKLKELFDESRVPYRARRYWPLVTNGSLVVAIPGLLMAPSSATDSVILNFEPLHPTYNQFLRSNSDQTSDEVYLKTE